jgi:hypothetical protein
MANSIYTGISCSDSSSIIFVSNSGLLTGKTYQDYNLTCITIQSSATTLNDVNKTFLYGPFNSCSGCTAPIESGVDYTTCSQCIVSGETIMTTVSQPHAIYTNEFGKAVEQMGSVVLGGVNGLNN